MVKTSLLVFYFAEAKSVTIQRMQSSLQEWDKQLKDIVQKKAKNGKFSQHYENI